MKNLLYTLLILVFISCDSDLDVIIKDNFDFEITTEQKEISRIGEEVKTSIKITPERIVKGVKYYFSYKLNKGKGLYKMDGLALIPGEEYELKSLETEIVYMAEELESNEVEISIRNDSDLEAEKLISYKIVDLNDFQVTVTKSANEIFFKEDVTIDFDIEKLANELDQDLTYELKYVRSSLYGNLLIGDNELKEGESLNNLSEGKISGIFKAKEAGDFSLTFLIKASNGKEHEVVVSFLVKKTDFEFKIYPSKSENYVNDLTRFDFEILSNGMEALSYKLTFRGQQGELIRGRDSFMNEDIYNTPGGRFFMDYKAFEISNKPIEFEVKASNGVMKKVVVDFESLPTNFEVTLGADNLSNFYQFDLSSSFNIIPPEVKYQVLTYKFYYETSNLGSTSLIEYNTGKRIGPGELLDMGTLKNGRIAISQQGGVQPQKGEIKFVFIDSNGVRTERKATVNWYD
ncbi:TraQ conjugal transfer family protein [Tenacibaculum sp. SDUM215027]|uniref:TraQ conjugal transfer family protein n=1 Tax=Tenacibaculum sp. SDUM215027 TaxID=3422596 RepID=UPI003D322D07